MPRKPGRMYRRLIGQAYTRREYMGGVPHDRITQYNMGDAKGKFDVEIQLLSKEMCQVRHSALEAGRAVERRRPWEERPGRLPPTLTCAL